MEDGTDLTVLARGTPGNEWCRLGESCERSSFDSCPHGDEAVTSDHLERARDRVLMGQTREATILNKEERERVAYHESGHALAAVLLPNADPLHKVSIIPRGNGAWGNDDSSRRGSLPP